MKTPSLAPLSAHPLLSVVVPSYNQGAFIRQTIESCLAQDYRPIEVVVVDGASTDGTVEFLRQEFPSVRVRSLHTNMGVEAFSEGVMRSAADAVLILDDDATPDDAGLTVALAPSTSFLASPELGPCTPFAGRERLIRLPRPP